MHIDPATISALEPHQFAAARARPFPRRKLSGGVLALLVLLRIYIVIAIPIVAYAFIHALQAAH
jgi:hypothetical protein